VVNESAVAEREIPLCAAHEFLDRPAVAGPGRTWTWREVHVAARALAAQLDATATLCNLCDSHLGFLVVWLAALRRRALQLLPPSSGRADLNALLRASAHATVIVDDATALKPEWREHAGCLVWEPQRNMARHDVESLAWSPEWKAECVRLYTSGSTGEPEPQAKTLAQLAQGALLLGARLDDEIAGGLGSVSALVCSVPPQHMFGFEASVMLPLIRGIAVRERRPLLPADVRAAFESCHEGAAWITTPLHLRSLQRAQERLPHCRAVVASTMPLDPGTAAAGETLTGAPVLEIYGSTETGALAVRRTARDLRWHPLAGVRLAPNDDGCSVAGSHFTSPQQLADRVAVDEEGSFELIGRKTDLIKVAGRRASLAGLNQLLDQLPGLEDGVFYLPATESPTERLVLIYAGRTFDRAVAEAWLRARIDPVFVPRAFIAVDRLPRSSTGKLARAALDEIYAGWCTEAQADRTT
jgi:acyl-coenzyme A synthetase/AMP-(fatty) acid ligase